MQISEEQKQQYRNDLANAYKLFSDAELAWDFHCNISSDSKSLLIEEANRRRINLCAISQQRHGGQFVSGWKWQRSACGGKHSG